METYSVYSCEKIPFFSALVSAISLAGAPDQNVHAQQSDVVEVLCSDPRYVVAYFNGIQESQSDALFSAKSIRDIVGLYDQNGNDLEYDSFYNYAKGFFNDV